MWGMMGHSVEFAVQQAILNQAEPGDRGLVGWMKAGKDNSALPSLTQPLLHPSHFWFEEFGKLGSSVVE